MADPTPVNRKYEENKPLNYSIKISGVMNVDGSISLKYGPSNEKGGADAIMKISATSEQGDANADETYKVSAAGLPETFPVSGGPSAGLSVFHIGNLLPKEIKADGTYEIEGHNEALDVSFKGKATWSEDKKTVTLVSEGTLDPKQGVAQVKVTSKFDATNWQLIDSKVNADLGSMTFDFEFKRKDK